MLKRGLVNVKAKRDELKGRVLQKQQEHNVGRTSAKEAGRNAFVRGGGGDEHARASSASGSEQQRGPGRVVVGKLTLDDLRFRQCEKRHVYATVAAERWRGSTGRVDPSVGGDGVWAEAFELALTDVAADVVLSLYGKSHGVPTSRDRYLGKVLVPLSRLYRDASVATLLRRGDGQQTTFVLDSWFQVYPLDEAHVHFEPVVPGMPGTGMRRPDEKSALPQVHLRIALELSKGLSLLLCAGLNPPFKPVGEFEATDFDPKHLKFGAARIKALAASARAVAAALGSVRAWERPAVSLAALLWYAYATLLAPSYQYPLLLALLVVALAFSYPYKHPSVSPLIWNDEIEPDPNMPDTLVKKLKLVPKLLGAIQSLLNKAAFAAERACNSINWTDQAVTVAMSIALLLAGMCASALLIAVQVFHAWVLPLNVVAFAIGLLWFATGTARAAAARRPTDTAVADVGREVELKTEVDAGVNVDLDLDVDADARNADAKTVAEDDAGSGRCPPFSSSSTSSLSSYWDTGKQLARNTLLRIPDAKEVIHRNIAASQEVPS